jgi:branched-chain amino acid transport system ATP-binding protein
MSDAILSVRNLETYYGPITAIRGVSFDVKPGQIVTILGANGAGKTTVLKSVCGAMEPQKGTVSFGGRPITGREPDWVARNGMAHVPEGREIFPFLTVRGNLLMGAYARKDKREIERDIEMVYGYFPILRERASSAAGYLSGGQQQMLAIGRGLMARPKLMLLDEPSLGLSPILTKEIFGIIRRLNQEQGVTMLLVEQNANMALKTAHYGYVLETGRIVLEGECDRLIENDDVREFYLGQKETAVRGKKRWKRTKRWR